MPSRNSMPSPLAWRSLLAVFAHPDDESLIGPLLARAAREGIIALQMHPGPPMKVQFKDIRLKKLN